MGWSVGGLAGRVTLVSLLALRGCAATGTRTDPDDLDDLRATMRGVYQAVERGDEAEYRRLVALAPGDAYSDALTATMFESIRLHQAAERFKDRDEASDAGSAAAVGKSLDSGDRRRTASSRPSSLAAVDYRDNARAMIKAVEGWTFTVSGDRATIDQLADRPGAPALRRAGSRWVLVPTPWDAPRDTATYRLAVENERRLAKSLAAARAAVIDGKAKSIEDVNGMLRNLLAGPATQP